MTAEKILIKNKQGLHAEAIAPVIISASRSTDIPAFYAKWFFNRLAKGYVHGIILSTSIKRYIFHLQDVV